MKFLILLLISFSAFANYIPKSKVASSENLTVWLKKAKCEKVELESCIKIDKEYSKEYSQVIPETQMKQEIETCLDENDCQAKLEIKTCEKGFAIKNLDSLEVYCTYLRPEHVGVDEEKKNLYDAKMTKKANKELKIKKGANNRLKCENALSYLSGLNDDKSEEEVDAMAVAFADIYDSLNKKRRKKSLRLINAIDDVNYADLKAELVEILKQ